MNPAPPPSRLKRAISDFRHSLADFDALPQLTLLGLLVGVITGGIMVLFRLLVMLPLMFWLPEHTENFEALAPLDRIALILGGTVVLIAMLSFLTPRDREMSVSHVIDRLHNHQAKLPMKNWLAQFAGATVSLISGQSVGREGPVVHLGAGAASQFAQWLRLPNNSISTLTGCGVAAAIAAAFDTPLAGVIFAMEVLALEYTIVGFVPVILASMMGALISKTAFGDATFLIAGGTDLASLAELPLVVAVGLVVALCAGTYIRLNLWAMGFKHRPLPLRLIAAGALSSVAVVLVPAIMGQGYDTVNNALAGGLLAGTLILVGLAKLLITPVVIGLGVPGGLIGPLLVIGACVGGAIGALAAALLPGFDINPGFYVLLGMAGMMAATLNAPLTALVTVLELSVNTNMVFPSMLVIVVACITTRQLFRVKGIFMEQLRHSERALDFGPAKQALRRVGVRSAMDTRFALVPQHMCRERAATVLARHPNWLIITDTEQRYTHAMPAADLANYLSDQNEADNEQAADTEGNVDLLEIPSRAHRLSAVHESASLYEAMQGLKSAGTQVLFVSGDAGPFGDDIKGVLTLSAIENYYKPVEFRHAVD